MDTVKNFPRASGGARIEDARDMDVDAAVKACDKHTDAVCKATQKRCHNHSSDRNKAPRSEVSKLSVRLPVPHPLV